MSYIIGMDWAAQQKDQAVRRLVLPVVARRAAWAEALVGSAHAYRVYLAFLAGLVAGAAAVFLSLVSSA